MNRKILVLLLGVLVAAVLLIILDPYVPKSGLRQKIKISSSPETTAFLESIASQSQWDRYMVPLFEGDRSSLEIRQEFDAPLIGEHYTIVTPNYRGRHTFSVRRKGEADFIRIFDSEFTTDGLSRRTTVNSASKPKASVVFLGCSFTWGSGVGDHETFSSVVAREEPDLRVYNLGMRGAGPNDVIDEFVEASPRLEDVKTEKGIVIYGFLADHIERALCRASCYRDKFGMRNGRPVPNRLTKSRYVIEDGELVKRGRFVDESRLSRQLKRLIFESRIVNALYYTWTQDLFPEDLTVIAKMLERIMIESRKKTGYDFYVSFFPDTEFDRHDELKEQLDALGVPYLDYSDVQFNKSLRHRGFFPVDGHPSRLGHEAYAQLLLRDLRKKTPELFGSSVRGSAQ